MVKKRIVVSKSGRKLRIQSVGAQRMILPILSDSNYKYQRIEVKGMCLRIQKNLRESSRKASDDFNSIIILK